MADDRWSIRGVAPALQRAVAERAKAERCTVGELVSAALTRALERPPGAAAADGRDAEALRATLEVLTARFIELERRLAVLEAAPPPWTDGGPGGR